MFIKYKELKLRVLDISEWVSLYIYSSSKYSCGGWYNGILVDDPLTNI
jgi:hypothetical protein